MSLRVSTAAEASQHLRKVENLLDRTLADLTGKGSSTPGSGCSAMLAEAIRELQSFSAALREAASQGRGQIGLTKHDIEVLTPRLKALLRGTVRAERLLSATAEFYRGWCAAGLAPVAHLAAYQSDSWVQGPALLAVEG